MMEGSFGLLEIPITMLGYWALTEKSSTDISVAVIKKDFIGKRLMLSELK